MAALGTDASGDADQALKTIANQTLAAASPVAPGAVTSNQQKKLNQLAASGTSELMQYYAGLGLHAASFNPGVLVKSGILATQAQWSEADTAGAIQALNLSSQDYNQYMLDQLKENEQTQKDLMVAASIAATIFTFGAASPSLAGALGAGGALAGSSSLGATGGQSEAQPGEETA
jgi:hypothetical protein